MKVVYIHFHLKTGGVTTVLTQQVNAVQKDAEVLVIAGTPPENPVAADVSVVEGLGYDSSPADLHRAKSIADSIIDAIFRKWKNGCDLIHVHNAILAKNKNLLAVIRLLQQRNFKLFIQIHDFAEDGRPSVYFEDEYPYNCHYGVINSRDYRILLKSGLKDTGLHKLFNMLQTSDEAPVRSVAGNRALYPVRALRRKNIGEAILLSSFLPDTGSIAITLPPNSPADIQSCEGWKTFVRKKNLPVSFDVGLGADFRNLVQSAAFIITTSIMEGFGFSYLEPWAAGKYLWGRKIKEICQDFEANGINLNRLYSRLSVPIAWIGRNEFLKKRLACAIENSDHFHYRIDPDQALRDIEKAIIRETVDFGILDEQFQKRIINRLLSDGADKNRLISLNPWLSVPGEGANDSGLIERNRKIISRIYNKDIYRDTLLKIYRRVINTQVKHRIDKRVLLSHFFDPSSFSLLTWGSYVE